VCESVVTTNLKTSNESGFSAEAAEMPKKLPRGSLIFAESKHGLPSTSTLNLSLDWRMAMREGRPRLR
jgi:hypothetical protein